jgi:hypothetical protein
VLFVAFVFTGDERRILRPPSAGKVGNDGFHAVVVKTEIATNTAQRDVSLTTPVQIFCGGVYILVGVQGGGYLPFRGDDACPYCGRRLVPEWADGAVLVQGAVGGEVYPPLGVVAGSLAKVVGKSQGVPHGSDC